MVRSKQKVGNPCLSEKGLVGNKLLENGNAKRVALVKLQEAGCKLISSKIK